MKISDIFLFIIALQGCASVQEKPLTDSGVLKSKNVYIAISRSDNSEFWLNDLIAEQSFEDGIDEELSRQMLDPALEIENYVKDRLKDLNASIRFSSHPNERPQGPIDLQSEIDKYKNHEILIDLKTGFWFLNSEFTEKYPIYSMQFHLVDIKRKSLLSSGICSYNGSDLGNTFTNKELHQNPSKTLNLAKDRVIQYCSKYVLGILGI